MKKFKLTIMLAVAEVWIEDGFDPHSPVTQRQLQEKIMDMVPWAKDKEIQASVMNVENLPDDASGK